MTILQDLHKAVQNYVVKAEQRSYETAKLGRLNADGSVSMAVTGRNGFVYVTKSDATITIALSNGSVPQRYGLPVKMRDDGGGYYTIHGVDKTRLAPASTADDPYGVPEHPFAGHTDTPANYTDAGGKLVAVNATEDAVEYVVVADTVAAAIHAATAKATLVDADTLPLIDSAAANVLKKVSWANVKATLKTYLDTLYVGLTGDQTVAGVKTFSDGISFGQDTLDHVGSGNWTIADGSGAGLTFPAVNGTYTRKGREVTGFYAVTFPATADTSGALLTGLPFVPSTFAGTTAGGGAVIQAGYTASPYFVRVRSGASPGIDWALFSGGSALTNADMSSLTLRGQFSYLTDDP